MSIVKSAWLKAGISLVLWPGLILSVAASEVRTLKYIEVTSLENISQLRLEFDEDNIATCKESKQTYRLLNNKVERVK